MNNKELKDNTIFGFIWKILERMSTQIMSFVVSLILARMLLPQDYGIVAIATIFITISNAFVTGGLGTSLIQKKEADELDFSTMLYASIGLSIIIYYLLWLVSPLISNIYNEPQLVDILRVMALRIPFAAINSIQHAVVAKKMQFKKYFWATFTGTLVSGICGIGMAYNGYGVWALVVQYLLNVVVNTVVMFFIFEWHPRFEFSYDRFKPLFSYGWKVMASTVIGTVFNELKGIILGYKYSSKDLAFYTKGESIPVLVSNNVNSTIDMVMLPVIASRQTEKSAVKNIMRRMIKVSTYVLWPILIGIALIADVLVEFLFTDNWLPCVPFLQILCIKSCFSIVGTCNLQAIKATGRSDIMLKLEFIKKPIYIMILLIMMAINPMIIAIGLTIYELVSVIINAYPNRNLYNYSLWEQIQDILECIFPVFFMILGVLLVEIMNIERPLFEMLVKIVTGVIAYLLASIFFRNETFYYLTNLLRTYLKRGEKG